MSDYYDYGGAYALAWIFVILPFILIFALAGYLISSWFLMRIFDKAGVQGKWRAWVPVYNLMVFAKLGDLSPWVMLGAIVASSLLGQIPLIGWIFGLVGVAAAVLAGWRVGLKLDKDWPFLLLWLIPGVGFLIWLGILAFTSSAWNPAIRPAPWVNSFLKDNVVWQGIPVQPGAPVGGPAYGQAPGGYQAPPPGYQPPAGYQPPPGYQPPAAPPAPPAGYTPPPAPPAPPASTEPPAAPDAPDAPRS